jgi:hypothetical protein
MCWEVLACMLLYLSRTLLRLWACLLHVAVMAAFVGCFGPQLCLCGRVGVLVGHGSWSLDKEPI